MVLDPSTLSNLIVVAAGFAAAFTAALWLSLIFWTYRDIRRRARDPLVRILAVLVVAVLFLPGMLVYYILRPARTLEEEFQQTLEEEALLQSIEDSALCPGCGRRVRDEWVACPGCYTRLKKPCHQCGKPMELAWNLCPFCGTPTPGMRRDNMTLDDALRNLPNEQADNGLSASSSPPGDQV
ncbi:MAG: zinc ribbon domain-containing protein [Anaerolineaceae bacterium]|nr:zinc ribbon domain-containing protein [Anaerolineaceae bacterium]